MPPLVIRKTERKEIEELPKHIQEWTSGLLDSAGTANVLSSSAFDPAGCFVADNNGAVIGCIAVTRLPKKNWLVIRYLVTKHAMSRVDAVENLLSRALEYVETKKPEFFRATTPSIQPYVDVYKSFGFKPLRRDFRMTWNLSEAFESVGKKVEIQEVTELNVREAAEVFVRAIRPYWDWRTEEQGGEDVVAQNFCRGLKQGEQWRSGSIGKEVVGLTGLIPDYYNAGHARFRGTFVVPEHRGKGIGMQMMNEATRWAKRLGQKQMTVFTFSYLECLAPGALMYIKSGGRIGSEYLQLQRST